jgi:hypothetical protein
MSFVDRKELARSLKEAHNKYYIDYLLKNPLPKTDDEYYDSEWSKWIGRIEEGKRIELAFLEKLADDMPNEVQEIYAEDVAMAEDISSDMYAALCVHLWSKIETTFRKCNEAWNFESDSQPSSDAHKIKEVIDFFKNTANIELSCIPHYNYVNSIRVLSNCYKHNDRRYSPDSFSIERPLQAQWRIEDNKRINYLQLHIKDILLHCGAFLEQLLKEVRQKIETRQ